MSRLQEGRGRPGAGGLLEVERVSQRYGRGSAAVTVLVDVDLTVGAGELVALSGRSGSGKSTLCHLAAGLERPSEGEVRVAGEPPSRRTPWSQVAVLPQRVGLADELTVRENVLLPLAASGRPGGSAAGLLERLDLVAVAGHAAAETSLGEQQRAGIARALVLGPRLAVLDEPTAHQDDERVERVLEVLVAAARQGSAVLVATHDERLLAVADRVVLLVGGRVVPGVPAPRPATAGPGAPRPPAPGAESMRSPT